MKDPFLPSFLSITVHRLVAGFDADPDHTKWGRGQRQNRRFAGVVPKVFGSPVDTLARKDVLAVPVPSAHQGRAREETSSSRRLDPQLQCPRASARRSTPTNAPSVVQMDLQPPSLQFRPNEQTQGSSR